jgi:hypothetical protein
VPGDERGKLVGPALEDAILDLAPEDLHRVFAVVVTSGTTNCGIVDDLTSVRVGHPRMHHAKQCVVCHNCRTTCLDILPMCRRLGRALGMAGGCMSTAHMAALASSCPAWASCTRVWRAPIGEWTSAPRHAAFECVFQLPKPSLWKHAFELLFVHNVRMCESSASRWTRTSSSLAASTAAPSCTCLEA